MTLAYGDFLATKRMLAPPCGVDVPEGALCPDLFPFQRAIVRWALKKGRAAIFADTGLGKTPMQLDWARHAAAHTNGRALILAPLAVARQTVEQGERFGIPVAYARHQRQAPEEGLTITNYEMLHEFDPRLYGAVVLDESGILKSLASKTRQQVIDAFQDTPMRLCCSATPAPNDTTELANHAEFLGVMSRAEFLATFFINSEMQGKGQGWRLKRHAAAGPFWAHLASWAMSVKKPSDLGYSDDGYILPPLTVHKHMLDADYQPEDRLFAVDAKGVGEHAKARHGTLTSRVACTAALVAAEPDEQWLIWCDYNDEDTALEKALRAPGTVAVRGSDTPEAKANALITFANGSIKYLITKPSIAAFGLNFQSCARQCFCGLSFSFEMYYQAIRRSWRFGQKRPVHVHAVLSNLEMGAWNAIQRKESDAARMSAELIRYVAEYEREELGPQAGVRDIYAPNQTVRLPSWLT